MYNTICEYRICYLGDLIQLPSILPKESKRLRKGTLPDAVNFTVSIFAPVKTGSFFQTRLGANSRKGRGTIVIKKKRR